jgi:hypothetical protein
MTDVSPAGASLHRARYRSVQGGGRLLGLRKMAYGLAAPVGGSSLLFPGRLNSALQERVILPSAHARWFFGSALVLWTDPACLTIRLHEQVHDGTRQLSLAERFLDFGDWSHVVSPLVDIPEQRDMEELVAFGSRYPEMPVFQWMMKRIARGRPVRRYRMSLDTEAKAHAYFRYFLALAESIRTQGFRRRDDLRGIGTPIGFGVRGRFALRQREIGAAIGPHGQLLRFLGGRHRTAIAQALGVPAVPVEIRLVHGDWLIEEVRRTGLEPAEALRHWAKRNDLRRKQGPTSS